MLNLHFKIINYYLWIMCAHLYYIIVCYNNACGVAKFISTTSESFISCENGFIDSLMMMTKGH